MNTMPSDATIIDEPDGAVCFEKVEAELLAIPDDQLIGVNLDIPSCVMTALGCLPKVTNLRPRIVQALIEFDVKNLDGLEDYTMALSYAHAQFLTALEPHDNLKALCAEAMGIRDTLHADANALCARHLLDPNTLRNVKGLSGYRNVAMDLEILATALTEKWDTVARRCAIDKSELIHAKKLCLRILRLVGLREQRPEIMAESAKVRVRAFTAFTRAYDQVRRAVTYLRWDDGDADQIAPSLWRGRGHKHEGAPAESPAASLATMASTNPAVAPATAPLASAKSPALLNVPVPGSNPFLD